jgi:hypothetical protein
MMRVMMVRGSIDSEGQFVKAKVLSGMDFHSPEHSQECMSTHGVQMSFCDPPSNVKGKNVSKGCFHHRFDFDSIRPWVHEPHDFSCESTGTRRDGAKLDE